MKLLAILLCIVGLSSCSPRTQLRSHIEGEYLVIELSGVIEKKGVTKLKQIFSAQRETRITDIVIQVDSPGGVVSAIESAVAVLAEAPCPTHVLVHRAISGAVPIALAADHIYLTPTGEIGQHAITFVPDERKATRSDARRFGEWFAEIASAQDHNPLVARAMADPTVELRVGNVVLSGHGTTLVLNARNAAMADPASGRPLLSQGTFDSWRELVHHLRVR